MKRWGGPSSTSNGKGHGGSLFCQTKADPAILPLLTSKMGSVHTPTDNPTSTANSSHYSSTSGAVSFQLTLSVPPGSVTIPPLPTAFPSHDHGVAIADRMLVSPPALMPLEGLQHHWKPPAPLPEVMRLSRTLHHSQKPLSKPLMTAVAHGVD